MTITDAKLDINAAAISAYELHHHKKSLSPEWDSEPEGEKEKWRQAITLVINIHKVMR